MEWDLMESFITIITIILNCAGVYHKCVVILDVHHYLITEMKEMYI